MVQTLTTQTNKEIDVVKLTKVFSWFAGFFFICSAFLFLVVFWTFAACAMSNWRKCFLDLQGFFFGCVVSICSVCDVKLTKVFSWFGGCFFILFAARFFFWLCCEHLQRVRCQIDESVFLIWRVFFLFICSAFLFLVVLWAFAACAMSNWRKCFLDLQVFFYLQRVSFFSCVVSICSVCDVKLTKVFSWFAGFFLVFCSPFLFWLCCEHLQRVRCQIDESVFLICRCFFIYL